eukprot:1930393-Amphidinium_carterae.1
MAGSRQLSDFQLGAAMVSIVQPMSEIRSPGPWSPSATGAVGAAFGVDTQSVHRPAGALGSTAQPASFPSNVSLAGAARRLSAPANPVVDEDAEIYIDKTCYYHNLVTGASPTVLPSSSFTIEAYIQADAKASGVYRQTARIVGWGPAVESGDWRHVSLELVDDWQKLVLELGEATKLESGIGLQDTVWHHIATTADQESGEVKIYFDHVEVAAVTRALSIDISSSTSFCVGGRPGGFETFKGHIRDVQIWDYARTASE